MINGCIYWHPSMNPTEFIDAYILDLLLKMSKEDKTIMLMGDFNIYILNYETNADCTVFLDSGYTIFSLSYITTSTWVTTHSKTLIDNIYFFK